MAIEAKPLPLHDLEEAGALTHPLWQGMGDNGTEHSLVGLYNAGIQQLQTLQEIRKQQGSAKDKLNTSDNPEAVTYREWREKGEAKAQAVDNEFNPQIKAHQDAIAELRQEAAKRKKLIETKLGEQAQKAIEAITAESKQDLDVTGAIDTYKTISDQLKAVVKMFVDFPDSNGTFASLKGFALPGPGVAQGAAGVAKGSGNSTGGRRFRWGTVQVGDTTLTQPSTKEITKAAGSNNEEHFKTALLTSLNGVYDNLPREGTEGFEPHVFEWNGRRISVALRASTPKAEVTEQVAA